MKLLALALLLVGGFASTANAGIFVEPYLGYGFGSYENGADKGKITGPVLGGRVAGEFAMVFIGGDYSMGLGNKINSDNTSSDLDVDTSMLFGVIGVNLPVVRAWVGYGLMNETKVKTAIADTTHSGGSHVKLGVGFSLIPMLSLNAEYIISDYKKLESSLGSGDSNLKSNTVLVSASVPLSF